MDKKFKLLAMLPIAVFGIACSKIPEGNKVETGTESEFVSLRGVAGMLAALPIGEDQMGEVWGAVGASSGNGYDEEYTLRDLFEAPGSGVGDRHLAELEAELGLSQGSLSKGPGTRGGNGGTTLRSMIEEYLTARLQTRSAGGATAESLIRELTESDMQIYWPYSEDWDGETLPIITFDPGMGSESNYGYMLRIAPDGSRQVEEIVVNEAVAREHPVWVINRNDDSDFTPVEMFLKEQRARAEARGLPYPDADTSLPRIAGKTVPLVGSDCDRPFYATVKSRNLMLKTFKMLRNYDSWFGGASEFFVKCGSIKGFAAKTEAELKQYSPAVTDMMIVVRRKYVGKDFPVDAILFSGFTNQLEQLAFLVTEDDGGTRTNWKCQAVVKINSKSYGFEMEIPFNEKDDIVWRGQLAASFFQEEDEVTGRFGDVIITFALE